MNDLDVFSKGFIISHIASVSRIQMVAAISSVSGFNNYNYV